MELLTKVIDRGEPGPHLLITGAVHGDEFEGPLAIRRLMECEELIHLQGKLTLVPIVNEAAYARGQRCADDGLDLARTCPGRLSGSVTERTAHCLSELIRQADFYIDLHTGGTTLAVWPMTGYMLHPVGTVLDQQRAMARAFNLPVVWGTDPDLEGRSLSVARDARVPAIYAEYEGGGRCSPAGIDAYVAGCLNVMSYLGMIRRAEPPERSVFMVEDPRPSSGHMQQCYPSPGAGCFLPAVKLGQSITAGEILGHLIDPRSGQSQDIRATQTGRVLVLRTFPPVQVGDSLGVILELTA